MKRFFYIFLLVMLLPVFVSCSESEGSVMHEAVVSAKKVEKRHVEEKVKEQAEFKEGAEENPKRASVGGLKNNGQPLRVNMDTPRQGKEILVVQDIRSYYFKSWCGSNALVVSSDKYGLELRYFNGKRIVLEEKNTYSFDGCTPDGKWAFFHDWSSRRIDKGRQVPEIDYEGEGGGWQGFVVDLYRYEMATGKRQKFAVVRDVGCMSSKVSPDGSKILLGCRHNSIMEMPEPKWEAVWLSKEWPLYGARWLSDSSGIATRMINKGDYLSLEVFGDDGRVSVFNIDKQVENVYLFAMIDEKKRFYFLGGERFWKDGKKISRTNNYYRCKVKGEELVCDVVAKLEGRIKRNTAFLPSGDIIFMKDDGKCINRLRKGMDEAECIVDMKDIGDDYVKIYFYGNVVSPDGKWFVFSVGTNEKVRIDETSYTYRRDLFVKELMN